MLVIGKWICHGKCIVANFRGILIKRNKNLGSRGGWEGGDLRVGIEYNKRMKRKLVTIQWYEWVWPLVLVAVVGYVAVANFRPGVWMTGWDTLHPEFDFGLNLMRMIFGVWREDQGVGAIAAHSHMADLPRILVMWLMARVVPVISVRYLYVILCLILGPMGMYGWLRWGMFKEKKGWWVGAGAMLAGLAYLFNLGTLQHFVVVFEMFAVAYAALPFWFWFAWRWIKTKKKKWLWCFFVAQVLSTPMAYASLLWYASIAGFIVYLFGLCFSHITNLKSIFRVITRSLVLGLIVIAANAFWILPNGYFVLSGAAEKVSQAKINRLFSPEAFLLNKGYGRIADAAILKNFLFNWTLYDYDDQKFEPMLQDWIYHLNKPGVTEIGYGVAVLAVGGMLLSWVKQEKRWGGLWLAGGLGLVMLINMNPPFESMFAYLRNNLPLFKEGLRFPFTKFSLLFMVVLYTYFGAFWVYGLELVNKIRYAGAVLGLVVVMAVATGLSYYGQPMFEGKLIDKEIVNLIPERYFELFDFLKQQPVKGRLAVLPIQTLWGWEYFDWGFQGPGFLWFGIPQPVLVRDFDRWSSYNENFYREMSTAVYARDVGLMNQTLRKYGVEWLVWDKSMVDPGGSRKGLNEKWIEQAVAGSGIIKAVKSWDEELGLYQVEGAGLGEGVGVNEMLAVVETSEGKQRVDEVYIQERDYVEEKEGERIIYPLADLSSEELKEVEWGESELVIRRHLGLIEGRYDLVLPQGGEEMYSEPKVSYDQANNELVVRLLIDGRMIEDWEKNRGKQESFNCDLFSRGAATKEVDKSGVVYTAVNGGSSCDYFGFSGLFFDQGYVVRLAGENRMGRGLKFYWNSQATNRSEIEELLDEAKFDKTFVVLPQRHLSGEVGGYVLNLETRSIGGEVAETKVGWLEIADFPYDWLKQIKLVPRKSLNFNPPVGGQISNIKLQSNIRIEELEKWGTSHYRVTISTESQAPSIKNNEGLVVLGQGYDIGWNAYAFSQNNQIPNYKFQTISNIKNRISKLRRIVVPWWGGEKLEHVRVNGWENGWRINSNLKGQKSNLEVKGQDEVMERNEQKTINNEQEIMIVFWPQYLEWLGFGLMGIGIVVLWVIPNGRGNHRITEINRITEKTQNKKAGLVGFFEGKFTGFIVGKKKKKVMVSVKHQRQRGE